MKRRLWVWWRSHLCFDCYRRWTGSRRIYCRRCAGA